jgi:hypothetical protein
MVEYILLTMIMSTTIVNGVTTQSVKWRPTPISVHATYKECEHAYSDLSGVHRRLTDSITSHGWPRYNAMLRCKKVTKKE